MNRYSEIEFYDLCQLVIMQSEEAMILTNILDDELMQLKANSDQLDLNDEFHHFQVKTAYLEFYYAMALRWLQLARRQEAEMTCERFYGSQTKAVVHSRLVHFTSIEVSLRNRAYHAGISVDAMRARYLDN